MRCQVYAPYAPSGVFPNVSEYTVRVLETPVSCPRCGGVSKIPRATQRCGSDALLRGGGPMKVVAFIEPRAPERSNGRGEVIEEILRHCGLWQASAPRAPPDMEDLVLDLDAAYSDSSIGSPEPSRPVPGTDLRRHRHVPGHLLKTGNGRLNSQSAPMAVWGAFCSPNGG